MTSVRTEQDAELPALVEGLLESYRSEPRAHHINRRFLPSRDEIIEIIGLLLQLMYPGYYGRQDLTDQNLPYHTGVLLSTVRDKLQRQISVCLCYHKEAHGECPDAAERFSRHHAVELTKAFLRQLPAIRSTLILDVQAAYDGDPAATHLDEIILAYPGLLAVTVYRIAHALHELEVPLMPRIMTEWAHAHTGADIHPGASIGPRFFIDHATGVVIGETSTIGENVKLYQGVTLGALSHPRDDQGRVIRGTKRHPSVEDNVTLYANATILGGQTVVGASTIVGGSVFLSHSVEPFSRVAVKPPELQLRLARSVARSAEEAATPRPAPVEEPPPDPREDVDAAEE
ncbi:MAG: serine O-acetyltransferase [Polyangiaceae bacterium]|nr:serine O-acetyltransferase [Polyangiaceae bacterium]